MSKTREWHVEITEVSPYEDKVEVFRNGAWFSDADDRDDAIGILNGQRATSATITEHGYTETISL